MRRWSLKLAFEIHKEFLETFNKITEIRCLDWSLSLASIYMLLPTVKLTKARFATELIPIINTIYACVMQNTTNGLWNMSLPESVKVL